MSMASIGRLLAAEQETSKMLDEIKRDVVRKIETTPISGVTVVSTAPMAVTTSASAIFGSSRMVLSPKYYFPSAQAKAVAKGLDRQKTISDVLKFVETAVHDRKVRAAGEDVPLNDTTLKILIELL